MLLASRDLEKREDGDPKMSDLRESGAIEQDADQVYFLIKQKISESSIDDCLIHSFARLLDMANFLTGYRSKFDHTAFPFKAFEDNGKGA